MVVRCRLPGDEIRLPGGTKSLKKYFVDRKIPASQRLAIPVVADDAGVLGVWGVGANLDRVQGGGTKSLKKYFVDRKIPASQRLAIPVVADDAGVLGVWGVGANLDRVQGGDPVTICFEKIPQPGREERS